MFCRTILCRSSIWAKGSQHGSQQMLNLCSLKRHGRDVHRLLDTGAFRNLMSKYLMERLDLASSCAKKICIERDVTMETGDGVVEINELHSA